MKILIADDHELFRHGISQLAQELEKNVQVIEASDHIHAFTEIENDPNIDLLLYDLNMPGKNGIQAVKDIAKLAPALPVIIISSSEDPSDMKSAIDAGAMGYIPKTEQSSVILNAIKLVLSGGIYISPNIARNTSNHHTADEILSTLTPRQIEVLRCIADGQSNKEIARTLNISDATIKVHLKTIFKALDVNNRTQAALLAQKLNLD